MEFSVLLLAAEPVATQVADCLKHGMGASLRVVADRRDCLAALRQDTFQLVLLEEGLVEADAEACDLLYEAAESALVVELNFAITSTERILRQIRTALARRSRDEARARQAAVLRLDRDLTATVTGLLLESQLALRHAGPELEPALRQVVALAGELRSQLRA